MNEEFFWRKNGKKLTLRKKIREEARRRFRLNRGDEAAYNVYRWVHAKIRAFYHVAPLSVVYPPQRKLK
jgi:hypothetical protein